MKTPNTTIIVAAIFLSQMPLARVLGGEIDPPAGPITPTMKPLSDIEPRVAVNPINTPGDDDSVFKITQPGSYYLTNNVLGAAGKAGVEIASNDVTLDLNGLTLRGVAGSLAGVRAPQTSTGITLRNGVVRGWGGFGIELYNTSGCNVKDITAIDNAGGIYAGEGAVIANCLARSNHGNGIVGGVACRIVDCTSTENGSYGFWVSPQGSISGCVARGNNESGILANGLASIANCVSTNNIADGFASGAGCTFTGCAAQGNGSHGIWVNVNGSAVNCTASQNGVDGFLVEGAAISNCVASTNGRDGIRLNAGDCSAVGNTCRANGTSQPGAGVRAVSVASRIDSNQVAGNDYGIVAAADCIVVRNSARANSSGNYSFPSGSSEYGQIVTNPGNNFVSSNPWANFAY